MNRKLFPQTLQACVERVTKPAFKKYGFAEGRIINAWEQIVGKELAAHCLPVKLSYPAGQRSQGVLALQVEGAWAIEVQHCEPQILEKIATFFGHRAVTRLQLLQAPLPVKRPKIQKQNYGVDDAPIRVATDAVEDKDLRYALYALGKAIAQHHSAVENPDK